LGFPCDALVHPDGVRILQPPQKMPTNCSTAAICYKRPATQENSTCANVHCVSSTEDPSPFMYRLIRLRCVRRGVVNWQMGYFFLNRKLQLFGLRSVPELRRSSACRIRRHSLIMTGFDATPRRGETAKSTLSIPCSVVTNHEE